MKLAGRAEEWKYSIGFGAHEGIAVAHRILCTHRPQSSSFLGLPSRILNMNPEKELLWDLWVVVNGDLITCAEYNHQAIGAHQPHNTAHTLSLRSWQYDLGYP